MPITLQSLGDDAPSGENLEYEPVFTELMLAAQPGEERQAGDEIIAAEDPDFRTVLEKAEEVLGRSHDLRAAVVWGQAEAATNGLPGFARATAYMLGCLTEFWDTCHPQLDAEDDDDPTMRINAVKGLAGTDTVLRTLRRSALTESRQLGRFSLRDIEIAEGEREASEDEEAALTTATISAAFQDTDDEALTASRDAAVQVCDDIAAINAVFDVKTPGQGPDLDPLMAVARKIRDRLIAETGGVAEVSGEQIQEAGTDAAAVAPPAGGGPVRSSADVVRALDEIIEYYSKNEPSSPLPLLLTRARKLVGADFMAIVDELAPSGAGEVKSVGGVTGE